MSWLLTEVTSWYSKEKDVQHQLKRTQQDILTLLNNSNQDKSFFIEQLEKQGSQIKHISTEKEGLSSSKFCKPFQNQLNCLGWISLFSIVEKTWPINYSCCRYVTETVSIKQMIWPLNVLIKCFGFRRSSWKYRPRIQVDDFAS